MPVPTATKPSRAARAWHTTGERPYACRDCGKAFRGSSELRQHQRVYSGEKPFVCADCGKAFVRNSELVSHRRTHTGERPYVCSVGSKPFSHRSNLNEHQKRHAGGAAPRLWDAPRWRARHRTWPSCISVSSVVYNRHPQALPPPPMWAACAGAQGSHNWGRG